MSYQQHDIGGTDNQLSKMCKREDSKEEGKICICYQVNDFIGSRRKSSSGTLVRVEDFLFASLAFPIGMFVGSAFWGLYAIDRELQRSLKMRSKINYLNLFSRKKDKISLIRL